MPRSIVAVDCTHEETIGGGDGSRLNRTLASWHASAVLLDRGKIVRRRQSTGTDAAGWWQSLAWLLARGGVTWIISCPASRTMSLLGLWEELEDGRVSIVGSEPRNGGLHRVPVPRMPSGPTDLVPRPGESARGTLSAMQHAAGGIASDVDRYHGKGGRSASQGYIVLEDPPTIVHARLNGTTGTIHWVDSRNYGVDVSEPEHTAEERASKLCDFAVCMVDTLRSRKLGGLKDTAGSQAMCSFRRRHMESIIVCHTDRDVLDLEGKVYYGGRSECFRVGYLPGPIYHYDFRSLYPSVCRDLSLPVRLRHYQDLHDDQDYRGPIAVQRCIADVTLHTSVPYYPKRSGNLVVYPTGRFRTQLSCPELTHAFEHGCIEAWHAVATYDIEPALRSYAVEMNAIREQAERESNREMATWAKAMGVCLPGKLGQKSRRWETWGYWTGNGMYAEWYKITASGAIERWRTVAGLTQVEVVESWSHDSVPAMAGWITSAARMKLLAAIEDAGWEHVYYVDTDSLFVDAIGSARLVESGHLSIGEMGYLQVEGVYHDMEVRGIKDYTVDGRHVSAGLPKGHKDVPGTRNEYWWTPWIGLATRTQARPTADAVLKHYHRLQPYRHGTILAGGKVVPLQMWE